MRCKNLCVGKIGVRQWSTIFETCSHSVVAPASEWVDADAVCGMHVMLELIYGLGVNNPLPVEWADVRVCVPKGTRAIRWMTDEFGRCAYEMGERRRCRRAEATTADGRVLKALSNEQVLSHHDDK
jgi:hypothetical protein